VPGFCSVYRVVGDLASDSVRKESTTAAPQERQFDDGAYVRRRYSDAYLILVTAMVIVGVGGTILLAVTDHDLLGTILLVGGDAAVITGFVIYLRKLG
jgi:hypothetical protein